jgi:flagellar basal body-associated protein FliL
MPVVMTLVVVLMVIIVVMVVVVVVMVTTAGNKWKQGFSNILHSYFCTSEYNKSYKLIGQI